MDVTSSVNPRCRDGGTGAAEAARWVAGIDRLGLEEVDDFGSKVTAERAAADGASAVA